VTSRLRSYEYYPRPSTHTKRYCSFIQYGLSHYQHRILQWYNCYFITWTVCMYLFYYSYWLWLYCTVLFLFSYIAASML